MKRILPAASLTNSPISSSLHPSPRCHLLLFSTQVKFNPNAPATMSAISDHYSDLLKTCVTTNKPVEGKMIHCRIIRTVPYPETFLANNLINMYSRFGDLTDARYVFDQIPQPNIFSWNTLLAGYSKSGHLSEMKFLFNQMPARDGVSWNSLISGYANAGLGEESVKIYKLMLREGCVPNRITFSTVLILCSNQFSEVLGRQIHAQIIKTGFESIVFVGGPLLDMYAKSGLVEDARKVFDKISERNLVMNNTMITGFFRCGMTEDAFRLFGKMLEKDSVSWTTMITGYTQNGFERDAIHLFREMKLGNFPADQFTFGSVLTSCGRILALEQGMQIHAHIIRTNYQENIFVGSALVDMYSKCKNIRYAETVFSRMSNKNIVSWTAMLVGFAQNGFNEEAINLFCEMQGNEIKPDDFTLGSVLSACANLATLEEGTQFHCRAVVSGLSLFITVANSIVTMYGKCGSIKDAHCLFDKMEIRDQVSWTALVSGYAQHGKAKETIELFENMLASGVKPDGVTFIGVLSGCSRAGLVEKGYHYFNSMIKDHGITPTADHFTCMIDLLGRAGKLKDAENFIKAMPCKPDAIGWATLLSSCRIHGNVEIGKWAAESLLEIEPHNPAGYILLTNIYAAAGKWDNVAELRRGMRAKGVKKEPGCSWIKYKNKVHMFSADDRSNPYSDQIYAELEKLYAKMVEEGYVPDMDYVLHDVEESEKERMLCHHSEKLAIAFGLIFIPRDLPVRVVKNLRVCGDCHTATKFISKIVGREILVRDSVRFHLFNDGVCSCGDFW